MACIIWISQLIAFQGLDLTDQGALLLLQPAIACISHYIDVFKQRGFTIDRAGRQWKMLDELLSSEGAASPAEPLAAHKPYEIPVLLNISCYSRAGNPNMKHKSTSGGIYKPNATIKNLPNVFQRDIGVELHCKKCSLKLISNWVAIIKGQEKVLRPQMGHGKCKSHYISLEGRICVEDQIHSLDFCEHRKYRKHCIVCKPNLICPHGNSRRYHCESCIGAGLVHKRRHDGDKTVIASKQLRAAVLK